MTVSVVIPAFNAGKFIEEAIASVLFQDCPADEIVIVDDGSTDRNYAALRQLHPSIKVVRQVNRGVSAARNVGCDLARSEYIAVLDADDVWTPGKLQAQMRHLIRRREIDAVFCQGHVWMPAPDGSGWRTPEGVLPKVGQDPSVVHLHYQDFLCSVPVSPSSMVVKKTAWKHIGGFDENIRFGEDHDFYFRLSFRGETDLLRMVGVLYRQHLSNASGVLQERNHWAEVTLGAVRTLGTTDAKGNRVDMRRFNSHLKGIRFLHGYEHFWAGNFDIARREFVLASKLAPWEAKVLGYLTVSAIPGVRTLVRNLRRAQHFPLKTFDPS